MYLCKVKIVSFGVLKLKMRNIERGFLFLTMICSLLFLFSCKNEEELITSFDWEGNWTVINSGDVQEDEEHNKPYTGTIKVKASNKDVIVMSGSLFGLLSSDFVEAEVNERIASFDKQTDDYQIVGKGELKNTNEVRFDFSITKDNETKTYTRIAVKIQ